MSDRNRPKPPNVEPPDPGDPPSDEEIRAAEALRSALETLPSEMGAPSRAREPEDEATRRDVELAAAIRAAMEPASISAERNRALLERALAGKASAVGGARPAENARWSEVERAGAKNGGPAGDRRDGQIVRFAVRRRRAVLAASSAAGLLAIAAAVTLIVRSQAPAAEVALTSVGVPTNRDADPVAPNDARPEFAMARSTAELFPEGIPRTGGTTARIDRIASARAQDFRQNQFARWRTR